MTRARPPCARERWDRYWFAPGPVLDLAIARILLVGLWQFVMLRPFALMTSPITDTFAGLMNLPESAYRPLPVFRLLTFPLGPGYRPTMEHLELVAVLTTVVGFLALVGLFTRASLAAFLYGHLFLIAHRYSYHDYHHLETIPLLTLAVLAAAPSGAALSLDAWWRARRRTAPPLLERTSALATWPRTLIAWMLSMAYLSAALSKLGGGGLAWMNGFTLQAYLLQAAFFWDLDPGVALGSNHAAMHALTWITMLFEGAFFLVLVWPRLGPALALVGALFHVGIWITMAVPFALYVPCFALLVPWTAWARRLRAPRAETAPATPFPALHAGARRAP